MAAAQEGSSVCVLPPGRNQASNHINKKAWGVLGSAKTNQDKHKQDHSKWVEAELKLLLENSLSVSLKIDVENPTKIYELLEIQCSEQEMSEFKDKVAALNNETKSWQSKNKQLMDKNDAHQQEVEALLQELADVSKNNTQTALAAARQLDEVRISQRQKLTDLRERMEEKDKELENTQTTVTKLEHQMSKVEEELNETRVEKQRYQIDNTKLSEGDNKGAAKSGADPAEVAQLKKDLTEAKKKMNKQLKKKPIA